MGYRCSVSTVLSDVTHTGRFGSRGTTYSPTSQVVFVVTGPTVRHSHPVGEGFKGVTRGPTPDPGPDVGQTPGPSVPWDRRFGPVSDSVWSVSSGPMCPVSTLTMDRDPGSARGVTTSPVTGVGRHGPVRSVPSRRSPSLQTFRTSPVTTIDPMGPVTTPTSSRHVSVGRPMSSPSPVDEGPTVVSEVDPSLVSVVSFLRYVEASGRLNSRVNSPSRGGPPVWVSSGSLNVAFSEDP